MRRLLPVLFCVAASTGLTACDDEPVSGRSDDDSQALYDAVRKAPFPVPAFADGDVELRKAGGGGVVPDFVLVNGAASDRNGVTVHVLSGDVLASAEGEVLCTLTNDGGFRQLTDADGVVLLSSIGPFVFEGQPDLAGKNPAQQAQTLMNQLRFSFDFDLVVEGPASSGDDLVEASVPVQFSSSSRKLIIASLVDGYCGSEGLETP